VLVVTSPRELQALSGRCVGQGQSIAFVPTMGCLHDGHMSLIHEGRRRGDVLVVSIYVNPLQFGPGEDLDGYPRSLQRDSELCRSAGVDILFQPGPDDLYPEGFQTRVSAGDLAEGMCGAARPEHFSGVCTVVLKLFNLVRPNWAIFGSKDYQQLQVVRAMVRDLNLAVEVVAMPIVREQDGLAMSSRNARLEPEQREQARCLSAGLELAEQLVRDGERDPARLIERVRLLITEQALAEVDYISLADAGSLSPVVGRLEAPAILALAVRFGGTRLIDNRELLPAVAVSPGATLGL